MVREQLEARGIRDPRVLGAFRRVPRHSFVPGAPMDLAYGDHPVTIGEGQTISQPYMVALMTEALGLSGAERVLEIGSGSGYQTAILLACGVRVWTVERIGSLSAKARGVLDSVGLSGASFRIGDGTLGWPEEAPFDRILVTAGAPSVPPVLAGQLGETGVMVIPVGGESEQELRRIRRDGGRLAEQRLCGCVFVKLVGAGGWQASS